VSFKVKYNSETLPFCSEPKYLGVTLDRLLTYRRHLESLRKKLTSRIALVSQLAGSGCGAGATTLRIATLVLIHSTAEYCAPVWCRRDHTRFIDPTINDVLRIVTGCLPPTPADKLPVLAAIQPAELRRNGATLSLGRRAMEPGHLLHSALTRLSGTAARRLKSRHPFVPAAQQLIGSSDNNNIRAAQWADHQWNAEWADNPTRFRIFIPDTSTRPLELPTQEQPGFSSTASAPVSDVSAGTYTNGVWLPLRPVIVARKNKRSTMLSSNVQSIELPMNCMGWRFWTMRQPNGCSTFAPRSNAAKQWFEQLAQKNSPARVDLLAVFHGRLAENFFFWLFSKICAYFKAEVSATHFFKISSHVCAVWVCDCADLAGQAVVRMQARKGEHGCEDP